MAKTNYDPKTLPRHGEAPCFRTFTDLNDVITSDNNHPEGEYEHHKRLPHFGARKPEISEGVQEQVLRQTGARVGTMTFNSLLRPANPGHAGEHDEERD